ncbi:uncharacterized protein SCHCODRAFT_02576302 [Schizophyllum commune H4-8]|uniref:C2H2-type domain-containing protein n=1 Tax=Schizophyllum commune (strain H4-8 / FGSC 9210) TaxID=578458 RepID=D8PS40_SCHCM|nr:uncharacterized protein SCHCODRAFT_02576302 [Schizophyllum commune H4-8]KAI5893939.1 hypothetical protein SCHCODRAFT_02576302 [Schizophyllum commune H4-8]
MAKRPGPSRTQSKKDYTPETLPGFTRLRCDDCGKRVVNRRDQQRHANLHLPDTPEYEEIKNPYPCRWPGCTKRFSQKTPLRDHLNVQCPECRKGFRNAGGLHHHRERDHQYKSKKARGSRESPRTGPYTKKPKAKKAARTTSPTVSSPFEDVHGSTDSPLPVDAPTLASGSATAYVPELSPDASSSSGFAEPSSQPSPADAVFFSWTSDNIPACVPVAGPSHCYAPSPAEASYTFDAFLPAEVSYPVYGQNFNDFTNVPAQQPDDGLLFTPPRSSVSLPLDDPTIPQDFSNAPFDTSAFSVDSAFPVDATLPFDASNIPANSFGFDFAGFPMGAPLPPLYDPLFALDAPAPRSFEGQIPFSGRTPFNGQNSWNDQPPYLPTLPQLPIDFAYDSLEEAPRDTFASFRFTHP